MQPTPGLPNDAAKCGGGGILARAGVKSSCSIRFRPSSVSAAIGFNPGSRMAVACPHRGKRLKLSRNVGSPLRQRALGRDEILVIWRAPQVDLRFFEDRVLRRRFDQQARHPADSNATVRTS
jgi:hypothetical protein